MSRVNDEPTDSPEMRELLLTRYEDVYELSEDGHTYVRPASLFGVPVTKITEGDTYWKSNWLSLDSYLAKEQEEEEAKDRSRIQKELNPNNKGLCDDAKRHQDNVSKHRKIREMFGETNIHPNQLIAKRYLPDEGLCEQEVMYTLGCKLSDFHVLHTKGYLTMEPWDFVRWRVGRLFLQRRPFLSGNHRTSLRTTIFNIGAQNSEDPLFRQAVRRSAALQNRSGSYGSKSKARSYLVNGEDNSGSNIAAQSSLQSRLSRPGRLRGARTMALTAEEREQRERRDRESRLERRAERERKRPPRPSTGYTGVNNFKKAQQNRFSRSND